MVTNKKPAGKLIKITKGCSRRSPGWNVIWIVYLTYFENVWQNQKSSLSWMHFRNVCFTFSCTILIYCSVANTVWGFNIRSEGQHNIYRWKHRSILHCPTNLMKSNWIWPSLNVSILSLNCVFCPYVYILAPLPQGNSYWFVLTVQTTLLKTSLNVMIMIQAMQFLSVSHFHVNH